MSYETVHINKICRTCLSEEENMRSVFSIETSVGETIKLFEMLMSCASVQVMEDDGLPSQVCLQCVHYITRAYSFKQLCERSENTLRELLGRPVQATYLELKPLLADEVLVSNTVTDIISTVSETLPSNTETLNSIAIINDKSILPTNANDFDIKDLKEPSNDLDMKYGSLQTNTILQSNVNSDTGQNSHLLLGLLKDDLKNSMKKSKMRIPKDETEQPVYSCEEYLKVSVSESLPSDSETLHSIGITNDNSILPADSSDFELNELKSAHDLDVKYDILGTAVACNVLVHTGHAGQNENFEKLDLKQKFELKKEGKESKKRGLRDETEQPLYPCEECILCFTTQKDLKVHVKSHLKKSLHLCKVCNQCFSSASTLCRHMKVHDGAKRHLCSECGKGFARSDDLTRHLRTHTGEKPFSCKICEKSFAQSFRLLEHMRAHANEKTFICSVCGKAFSRYTSLAAHNKTHTGIKSHQCSVCGKKLCGSGSLAMHMKTHTGLKDHICSYCGKGFTTPSNLIIHKRTHTGERPYICTQCGKGFPDPSRLTVHARSHSGEKPYVCNMCGRGCVSSSQLKKHMRIHTGEKPYMCTMCPKAFPRSEDLRIHIKTHTGDRNHICSYCKKGFYQASTLKVHMRIHTGEKPYTCNICDKAFSQTGPLSTHMKTH